MSKRAYKYVAVDWSGAKRAKGISVAVMEKGYAPVLRTPCNNRRHWKRGAILNFLTELADCDSGVTTIVGIDCVFSLPFIENKYLPHCDAESAFELWKRVDAVCEKNNAPDFYAGPFISHVNKRQKQFWLKGKQPSYFDPDRLRETEKIAAERGVKPESPFKLIGPKQVGKAGLTGMRVLHQLKKARGDYVAIWPFEKLTGAERLIVVEIFPTLYRHAAMKRLDKIKPEELNCALTALSCEKFSGVADELTNDDTDALISAAGMAKTLKDCPQILEARGMDAAVRKTEGWIFGVPWTGVERERFDAPKDRGRKHVGVKQPAQKTREGGAMSKTATAQQDSYFKYLEKKVAAAREDIAAGRVYDAEDVEREFAGRRAKARAQAAGNDTGE